MKYLETQDLWLVLEVAGRNTSSKWRILTCANFVHLLRGGRNGGQRTFPRMFLTLV